MSGGDGAVVRALCPDCWASTDYPAASVEAVMADPSRNRCARCHLALHFHPLTEMQVWVERQFGGALAKAAATTTAVTVTPGASWWNATNRERTSLPADQGDRGDRLLRDALGGQA